MKCERHTQHCLDEQTRYVRCVREYEAKWPNYCRACEGRGCFVSYSYSPTADYPMDDVAICDECVDTFPMKCPRCGKEWVYGDSDDYENIVDNIVGNEIPCPNCGWNWGKNEGDAMPYEPECMCYGE